MKAKKQNLVKTDIRDYKLLFKDDSQLTYPEEYYTELPRSKCFKNDKLEIESALMLMIKGQIETRKKKSVKLNIYDFQDVQNPTIRKLLSFLKHTGITEKNHGKIYKSHKINSYYQINDEKEVRFSVIQSGNVFCQIKWYCDYEIRDGVLQHDLSSLAYSKFHTFVIYGWNKEGWLAQNPCITPKHNFEKVIIPYETEMYNCFGVTYSYGNQIRVEEANNIKDKLFAIEKDIQKKQQEYKETCEYVEICSDNHSDKTLEVQSLVRQREKEEQEIQSITTTIAEKERKIKATQNLLEKHREELQSVDNEDASGLRVQIKLEDNYFSTLAREVQELKASREEAEQRKINIEAQELIEKEKEETLWCKLETLKEIQSDLKEELDSLRNKLCDQTTLLSVLLYRNIAFEKPFKKCPEIIVKIINYILDKSERM